MITGRRQDRRFIDWRAKGLPPIDDPVDLDAVGDLGWNIFDGRFLFPTMVVKRAALEHNIALMAEYCRDHGVSLAPHGKTTMAPEIFRRQLEAGAWAITVATPWQARAAALVGVPRILIANQVVDEGGLAWLAASAATGAPEIYCQVDSREGVERLEHAVERTGGQLQVLVEIGIPGGRTGVRNLSQGLDLAKTISGTSSLRLAGVTSFEGIIAEASPDESEVKVTSLLDMMRATVDSISQAGLWGDANEIVVSAGGSQYFDSVVRELSRSWDSPRPVRVVIRSGCYVTHDEGAYDATSPFGAHAGPGVRHLQPAIEIWAAVLSTPEPGLALIGAGRRDLPHDSLLPVVHGIRRANGRYEAAGAGLSVFQLNDQHAYVSVGEPAHLQVGDLVALGISHPCTAFDKWRFVPLVEEDYRVSEVLELIF